MEITGKTVLAMKNIVRSTNQHISFVLPVPVMAAEESNTETPSMMEDTLAEIDFSLLRI
jgi:hypothetical protein